MAVAMLTKDMPVAGGDNLIVEVRCAMRCFHYLGAFQCAIEEIAIGCGD